MLKRCTTFVSLDFVSYISPIFARYIFLFKKFLLQVVQRRVDMLAAEGVKFIVNVAVAKDVPGTLLAQVT